MRPVRRRAFRDGIRLTALLMLPALALAEPVDYTGHQLVRVRTTSPQDLERIQQAGGEPLDCFPGPPFVDVRVAPGGMDKLAQAGFEVKLLSADLGPATTRHLQRAAGSGPFDGYMPLADIEQYVRDLAALRPDLCAVSTIGFSLQNRPIIMLHITGPGGGDKPGVFYHGLHHAREWITAPVVLYLANHLVNQYDTDPCIQDLVDRTNIYLAPCVNPDGYTYSWTSDRLWRKNRRPNAGGSYGVDLNRNWAFGWGWPGASSTPSDPTYRGTAPFSEPETQVLSSFIMSHPDIRAYMDYHSYSQLILWPWGYQSTPLPEPDRALFDRLGHRIQQMIAEVHGKLYQAGPINPTLYAASGSSVDWVYGDRGIVGMTIELRPTDFVPGFELPPEEIIPTCAENLPAILHLTEWAANDLIIEPTDGALVTLVSGVPQSVEVDVTANSGGIVPGSVRMFYRLHPDATFTEVVMSPAGGDSFTAMLPATNCAAAPEVYFTAESTGGQTVRHPCGAPAYALTPTVIADDAVFYSQTMDANPGWTTSGQWAWGQPTGGGGEYGSPDPTSGHTGANVYGYNLNGDYPNGLAAQHLTSTAINCTGKSGVTLSFWRWLGVEQSAFDHAAIAVSNNGATWTTIWQNSGAVVDSTWVRQEFDISAVADNQPTVYLRWTMGSTDGGWRFCGWNIDDVTLATSACDVVTGDWNGDGQVDVEDLAAFPPCVNGPTGDIAPGCGIFDFNADEHVDLDDYAAFQQHG